MTPSNPIRNLVTPANLDRRAALKGITLGAGAVVLQPFLNLLAAETAGKSPARVIFVLESNGLYQHHIQPKGIAYKGGYRSSDCVRLLDLPLADYDLPEPISALAPFKDRMTVLQGLSHKTAGGGDHGKGFGALGCFHWRKGAAGQTIDHALGMTQANTIPVVGLGIHPKASIPSVNSVSASGPNSPIPILCQPDLAIQSVFGSATGGNAMKAFNARNKLLDWIRSDVRRVRNELPQMERSKLDIYLNAFEQMRTRQDKVASMREHLKERVPALDKFNSQLTTERFEAQCAVAAATITSGITNVVTIDGAGGVGSYHTWKELGVTTDGHKIGHMAGQPAQEEFSVPIRKFHAERVADLARRLDGMPEGNGTVLDNSLIVYMSDSGEDHHGSCLQWPMVLIGNLGGRLKTAGRYLQYPKYNTSGHRTVSNFYLALLHAMGDRRATFGDPDPELKDIDQSGPLAEILA